MLHVLFPLKWRSRLESMVSRVGQGTHYSNDQFVILNYLLVIELHVNKLIIGRTTWGCDCEDIVSDDCSLSSTSKYSRELSTYKSLFQ